jgi:hypothetical protein
VKRLKPDDGTVYIGRDADRTNPNRLNMGAISMSDEKENKVEVVEKPNVIKDTLAWLKVASIALVSIAGLVLGAEADGMVLPGWLKGAATVLIAVGAAVGIASPGLKKKTPPTE